jgi:phosphate transport system permease protein
MSTVSIIFFAWIGVLIVALLFGFIMKESFPALTHVGAEMLTSKSWYPVSDDPAFGLLTMIVNTLFMTLITAGVTIPIGYIIAFFIYEYANRIEKKIIKTSVDLLSGVPSVLVGSFLLLYISPGFISFEIYSTQNLLLGCMGLAIISLPYTVSLMEEALSGVDITLKEGALALGVSRFSSVFRVVSRAALSGLFNAGILTVNRIIGETMVVLMVAGGAAIIPKSLFDPVRPLTAVIASEMGEVEVGSTHYSVLFFAGFLLLAISFFLTLVTYLLVHKKNAKSGESRLRSPIPIFSVINALVPSHNLSKIKVRSTDAVQ